MKKVFIQFLLTTLMSMVGTNAFAHDIEVANSDGVTIYYRWINNNTELEVSCRGESYLSYENEYIGNIDIPESVQYEDNIFQVTSIGVCAFRNCSGLTSVTIPNSVKTVNQYAFDDTQWYDNQPNGMVYVGKFAYKYKGTMPSKTKITLLEGTIGIAGGAFADCSNLISITMPNSIQSIGERAFHGCSGLASITIPDNVTSIGMSTFWECSALTSLTIPNSVKSISDWAFYGCSKLTSVTIGSGLNSISSNPFEHCPNLVSIKVESGNKIYDSRNNCNAIIESNTNKLIVGCKNTLIPNTVTSIGLCAFEGCSNMTSITIPNSVKEIGSCAFQYCTGLTSIKIPEGVTSLGNSAFGYCNNLSSITIPSTVTSIGDWALVNTAWYKNQPDGLIYAGKMAYKYKGTMPDNTNINITPGTVGIADNAFGDCYDRLTSVTIPNGVISIGYGAFSQCSGLSSVTIPNSVKYIGGHAFFNCVGLTSISIGNSVTTIGEDAFYFCIRLTSITIPQSVNSIGRDAFHYCNRLTSIKVENGNKVYDSRDNCNAIIEKSTNMLLFGCMNTTISNSVTKIGKNAFYGCTYLTSITIPNSIVSIDENAFTNCSGLVNLISEIQKPFILDHFVFGIAPSATIVVPKGTKQLYMTTKGWNHWKIIEAGENTDVLEKRIIHVETAGTLPDLTTEYEKYAIEDLKLTGEINGTDVRFFNNIPILKKLDLYEVKIVQGGDSYYESKEKGRYGDDDKIIPHYTKNDTISMCFFSNKLTSVILPKSVTSIDSYAFSGCSALTSITIPNSVTSIGRYAFLGCIGLTSIVIPNSVTSIGSNTFGYCNNLQYICFTSDAYPSAQSLGVTNCQYIMPQTAFDGGIPTDITNYATYGVTPMYIKVKSTTATSATLELTPIDIASGKTNETTTYETKVLNLMPRAVVKGSWEIEGKDRGVVSFSNVKTQNLVMTVQPAQALSTTKAKLSATVNEPNDDKHYGFEWRRIGVDDLVPSNVVYSQLYDGHIVGTLSGLNPDISYKYRPFYKSDSGETFYGEWIGFLTGDANVFFEPEVHTNEPVALTENGAQLSGVWVEGTEDIQEKGIEYWPKNSGVRSTRAGNVTAVIVKGNNTSVTLEGLEAGTEYVYRSYLRTASGTVYGEEKTFKTPLMGDANNDGKVNVADVVEVVNAKAGKPSASFNMTNADVDGNGSITEAEIVKIIMQK